MPYTGALGAASNLIRRPEKCRGSDWTVGMFGFSSLWLIEGNWKQESFKA